MRLSRCFPPATRPPDPLAGVLSTPTLHHWRLPTPTPASVQPRQRPVDRQEVPPAISRASQAVQWQLQPQPVASTSKSTLDSPSLPPHEDAVQTAEQELRIVLQALPTTGEPIRVKHRKTADVQAELALSRRACLAAYSAVAKLRQVKDRSTLPERSGSDIGKGKAPMRNAFLSPDLERKVARLVGETMRLLLRLGHVHAATELDRAFFTSRKQPRSERRKRVGAARGPSSSRGRDRATSADPEEGRLGDGLGLRRSAHQLAWMQAVAAGIEMQEADGQDRPSGNGRYDGGRRFLENLEGLLVEGRSAAFTLDSATTLPRTDKLAFAARQMGRVQRSIRNATCSTSPSPRQTPLSAIQAELATWISAIRKAECEDADELVSIALLESGLERLEQAVSATTKRSHSGRDRTEAALLHKVEEDINRLVRSLEQDRGAGTRLPTREASRQAHILALAIRFMLFRHHHSPSVTSRAASAPSTDTLLPAAQLYAVLLKLRLPANATPALLIDVRARQTSSLFRLLDAYLDAQAHSQTKGPYAFRHVERVLDLLDLSLRRLETYRHSHSPMESEQAAPFGLGVSNRTYQRILRALSEPSRPRRTHHTTSSRFHAAAPSPPFAFLSRALDTIARARSHDARLRAEDATSTSSGQAVFAHPKTTIHFVRSWFAAPPSASTSSALTDLTGLGVDCRPREDGSEIQYRLRSLLAFVDAIDAAGPAPGPVAEKDVFAGSKSVGGPRATLRSRKVVARAVREIVEQRWGTVGPTARARVDGERSGGATECPSGQSGEHAASWTEAVVESTLERWLALHVGEADSPP